MSTTLGDGVGVAATTGDATGEGEIVGEGEGEAGGLGVGVGLAKPRLGDWSVNHVPLTLGTRAIVSPSFTLG